MAVPSARAPVTVSVFYPLTQVGKRRGGVFLKTGMVAKKQKQDTEVSGDVDDDDCVVDLNCVLLTAPLITCASSPAG